MAQDFKRYAFPNIGTTATDAPDGTNFTTNDTIVGVHLANKVSTTISADAYILYNNATDTEANRHYLVKAAPIPPGSALQLIDGGAKIVVQANDRLWIKSDTADSLSAWVSVVEDIDG